MWNPSLKSHIAEVTSSAPYCARPGCLLGHVTEMLAAAGESTSAPVTSCRHGNRDFYLSPLTVSAQQSSLL